MSSKSSEPKNKLTVEQVRAFLKDNPDFIRKNSDVLIELSPPEQKLGDGILDFQQYMVKNLQKDSKDLKSRYEVLVEFCRDNMSVQTQVHQAALRLIRTRSLEQLLEAVTIDLANLFDVDVVRLAMESDIAGTFETSFSEHNYSGIVLIDSGLVDAALGKKKNVLLVEECASFRPPGFEQVFADCADMVESCALLRLNLEQVDRKVILAFGVRYKSRFHPGQGIELLNFLAQIVAHQLDMYLYDLTA